MEKQLDRVRLLAGDASICGLGMLNSAYLWECGYRGDPVPVVEREGSRMRVQLPNGRLLWCTEKDIAHG